MQPIEDPAKQASRNSIQELALLNEIAFEISSSTSPNTIISSVCRRCVDGINVEESVIYLFDDTEGPNDVLLTLDRKAARGAIPEAIQRLPEELTRQVIESQETLIINDVAANPHCIDLARTGMQIHSLMVVPLSFRGRLLGVLNLYNKKSGEGFTQDDERLMRIVATQMVPALQNARTLSNLKAEQRRLSAENLQLRRQVENRSLLGRVIGGSAKMRELLDLVERIADRDVDVLITGESGTGKDLIARTIHNVSTRAKYPLVTLNCAALPDNLLEAELFGIEKGVATGVDRRPGQFENASGGTLFLDEIADLSLGAQAKILRALQERKVRRLGGRVEIDTDVRLLAATNKDLVEEIARGRFREDLYYRLNVIGISMPSLRDIRDDIPLLASHFLTSYCEEFGRPELKLSPEAMIALINAPWPGNVRQLQNELKRAAVCAEGELVRKSDLSAEVRGTRATVAAADSGDTRTLDQTIAAFERETIEAALARNSHNQVHTAASLGVTRQGLIKKMKRLGIVPRPGGAAAEASAG